MLHPRGIVPGVELLGELGRGARSVVYRASRQGQQYAVKVLRTLENPADTSKFRREATLLAALRHPGLARIYEVGQAGDLPYLIMDLIEGKTLTAVLTDGPLAEHRAVGIASQVADVLNVAHQAGLVHRDVKPDNILIRPDGQVFLIDFGLAARAGEDAADTAVGTFTYSAPEQTGMLRRVVDGRADLYSLGAMLFECLTGRTPFVADDTGELLRLHLGATAPTVRSIRPDVSPALTTVIARLLEKDPDYRYQSGQELRSDLARITGGQRDPFPLARHERDSRDGMLVGRGEQMRLLLGRWRTASAGHGGMVLVQGPPGGGKSRLVREVAATVRAEGRLVLHGKCVSDNAPLAPLREAIERHLQTVNTLLDTERARAHDRLRTAAGTQAALLAPLAPSLGRLIDAPAVVQQDNQDQFAVAVAAFLVRLADMAGSDGPGALLHLDDVPWCDAATRGVLSRLAPMLADSQLMVVMTARDETALDHREQASLDALLSGTTSGRDLRLFAGPLDETALSSLVAERLGATDVPQALICRLAERTGGNPLEVLEYVHAVIDAGLLQPSWGTWLLDESRLEALQLPDDLVDLMLSRIDALGGHARSLLTAAAIIGNRFTLQLAASIGETDETIATAAFANATQSRLVESTEGGFVFVHDRVREALLAAIEPDKCRRLHQRAAEALEVSGVATPQKVYAVAHHYLHGETEHTPQKAYRAATEAGALALDQHAASDALDLLRRAQAVARAGGIDLDAIFHTHFAVAALRTGRPPLAIDHINRALSTETEPLCRAALHDLLASAYQAQWDGNKALDSMHHGLAELGMPIPRNPVMLALSTLTSVLQCLLLVMLPTPLRVVRGIRREKYRRRAQLLVNGTLSASIAMRRPVIAILTLRALPLVSRLGAGPEYAATYCGMAVIATIAKLPTLAQRFLSAADASVAGSGDIAAIARIAWMRATIDDAMQPLGATSGQAMAEALEQHGQWLNVSEYLTGIASLGYMGIIRGYPDHTDRWYRRALARTTGRADIEGNAVAVFGAQAAALAGHPTLAATLLATIRDALTQRPHARGLLLDLVITQLQLAVEQGEVGDVLDQAITAFDDLHFTPDEAWPPQRVAWIFRAYGRLAQAAAAGADEREQRLRAAARSVIHLRRASNGPVMCAYHRVAQAYLQHLRRDHRDALRTLVRLDAQTSGLDLPLLDYEIARLRARALTALGHVADGHRQAGVALMLAATHGWQVRARWIHAEFGTELPRKGQHIDIPTNTGHGRVGRSIELDQRRLRALQQVSLAAVTVLEPAHLARVALDEIVRIFAAERAFLFLYEKDVLLPYLGRDSAGQDLAELTGYGSTLVQRVLDTGTAIVVTGSEQGAALGSQSTVAHGLRSIMVAPLALQGHIVGVAYIDSRIVKGIFTADDVDILTAITNHVAMSLETARASQLKLAMHTAQRERDLAETLRQAMAQLTGTLDPDEVARRLLEMSAHMVPVDAAVLLHQKGGTTPQVAAVFNHHNGVADELAQRVAAALASDPSLGGFLAAALPAHGQTPQQPGPLPTLLGGTVAWLSVPLYLRGEQRGLLVTATLQRPYTDAEMEIVAALAGQGLAALDNAALFRQVEHLASRDGLTGLYNRRHFSALAAEHLTELKRFAAIMVDIDFFKKINDTHGHGVGDQVIQQVAHRLAAHLRDQDIICRYGGEEFAILLSATTDGHADDVAKRLHAAVSHEPIITDAGTLTVTVSVGVATPADDGALDVLLGRADAALYDAKRAGRNRVMTEKSSSDRQTLVDIDR